MRLSRTADTAGKEMLHPRNRHRGRYDFPHLITSHPPLAPFVATNAYGDESIDFADPAAVKALNAAILKHHYQIAHWDIPPHFLCPPIPGRADYLHYAADLLAEVNAGTVPHGPTVRVLDVGVGANCVYPLVGHREYGWSFVGSETNPIALATAQRTITGNPGLADHIEVRLQAKPGSIFRGIVRPAERFALVICNPPFHGSLAEAQAGTQRKLANLKFSAATDTPVRNFGGHGGELWCPGGETAFVSRMIAESATMPRAVLWFTSLIAKAANLPAVLNALTAVKPRQTRVIEMAAGQKKSRLVAWTFHDQQLREAWRSNHWQ